MNIQANNQQPISDDQELAKVLAGVTQQADGNESEADDLDLSKLQLPNDASKNDKSTDEDKEETTLTLPSAPEKTEVSPAPAPTHTPGNSSLDSIKKEALTELRPLVDKLEVSAEEKFDTYLLLLRSTDDQDLIAPAHEAARAITDEARRAQALLDIIKEIDYLSSKSLQQN